MPHMRHTHDANHTAAMATAKNSCLPRTGQEEAAGANNSTQPVVTEYFRFEFRTQLHPIPQSILKDDPSGQDWSLVRPIFKWFYRVRFSAGLVKISEYNF
ncbi:unnamed protein product [Ceratitis capitata]|uniref:(Mediterranean fruit fly) hypothetical protein n=1 Tax=Ceratitis capitata TaxID=7213 RepID=A0A811UML5_CERCA|nr:unnamed protein product [Ceratitis capitata]